MAYKNPHSATVTVLPTWKDEVERFARSEAFLKMEEYRYRLFEFEKKYGMPFARFRVKVTKGKEDFAAWDDLIEWEGVYNAYQAWQKRYNSLH